MIPCYQLCKDLKCPHWTFGMLECERLPDDCDYAVEHLVISDNNQYLDGMEHGVWENLHESENGMWSGRYIAGKKDGDWSFFGKDGELYFKERWFKGRLGPILYDRMGRSEEDE